MKRTAVILAGIVSTASFQHAAAADTAAAAVVSAEEVSPALPYDAGFLRVIVASATTHGKLGVVELTELPGYETPWHRHDNFEESFYVLEGALTMRIQGKTYELPAGSFVSIPRGTPHSQGNATRAPVKLLTTFSPGGFEDFFLDRVELFKTMKRGSPGFGGEMRKLLDKHSRWIQPAEAPAPSN